LRADDDGSSSAPFLFKFVSCLASACDFFALGSRSAVLNFRRRLAARGNMGKPSGAPPDDKPRKRPSLSSEDDPPKKPATAFGTRFSIRKL